MKTPTLYPFQVEDVKVYHDFNGIILNANEMGTGKTLETLKFIHDIQEKRPAIVICPAILKTNWQEEAKKFYQISSCVLSTRTPTVMKSYRHKELVIINYDILGAWMSFLKSLKAPIIVMDEGQMISGILSQRTRACTHLSKKSSSRIILSGTPILNRPWELYPLLHILRPRIWDSPFAFGMEYCAEAEPEKKWQFKGATNLEKLHKILKKEVMIRRTKAEVLKDLPPKRRFVVPLPIDNRREYQRAEHDLIGWLASFDPLRAKRAERALRFVKFGYLKRLAAKLKMRAVYDWIDVFLKATDRKLIVGAIHRKGDYPIIPWLYERYKNIAVKIDGSTSLTQRDIARKRFQEDEDCRIIILQAVAGGVGINLQGSKRTVALVEMPWNPAQIKQLIDRAHRIGTLDPVDIYFLVGENTVESRVCEIIQDKQSISDRILDGVDNNADSLSIFDELTKAMLNKVTILKGSK